MLKVIGTKNCNRCTMTTTILNNKGVKYEYISYEDDLTDTERYFYFEQARKAGHAQFPILISDSGKYIRLQDIK